MSDSASVPSAPHTLTATGRYLILAAAFLGWLGSGMQLTLMNLANRSATEEFVRAGMLGEDRGMSWERLSPTYSPPAISAREPDEVKKLVKDQAPLWYARYNSFFLLGAAFGGLLFGWMGDRFGRVKAMGLSIVWYSLFAGLTNWIPTPEQVLLLRFLSAMGVGGMWPSGVSLASEAWSDVSRPMLSGLIGASANFGIVFMSYLGKVYPISADSWRWTLLVAATPVFLGFLVWVIVPESPSWLAARSHPDTAKRTLPFWAVFRPPLLWPTLLGIALGAIPLLGGWGVTSWLIPWSEKVRPLSNDAKAWTSMLRAGGGAIGSLFGGWLANLCGRRLTYFMISLLTLGIAEYIFFFQVPTDVLFPYLVFTVGLVSTVFFGWLPLYLPELFPTEARATGTGVSFNFGRILTAIGVLGTGALTAAFHEDYAAAGRVMSLIYALGMVVILFAPDTTKRKLSG